MCNHLERRVACVHVYVLRGTRLHVAHILPLLNCMHLPRHPTASPIAAVIDWVQGVGKYGRAHDHQRKDSNPPDVRPPLPRQVELQHHLAVRVPLLRQTRVRAFELDRGSYPVPARQRTKVRFHAHRNCLFRARDVDLCVYV